MALSYVTYTGDGVTTNYTVPFSYLEEADVTVLVDDVSAAFSFLNETTVVMDAAPALDAVVRIERATENTERLVDWTGPSTILPEDLNMEADQLFYLMQETADLVNDLETFVQDIEVSAGNLPTPIGSQANHMLLVTAGEWAVTAPSDVRSALSVPTDAELTAEEAARAAADTALDTRVTTVEGLAAALPIANGGTGAATAVTAFTALKQAATAAATGVVELATNAEVKAGTDTARVPSLDTLKHHRGVAKAWINFNGDGVVAINNDENVDSITDHSTGDYTVTFATPFTDATYAAAGMAGDSDFKAHLTMNVAVSGSASSFRLITSNSGGTPMDSSNIFLAFYGDQI